MVQNYKIAHRNRYERLLFVKCKSRFYQMQKRLEITCLLLRPNLINHRYELDNLILGRIV